MDASARQLVRERAGHPCEYCRKPERHFALRFHIDHILPRHTVARMPSRTSPWPAQNVIFGRDPTSPAWIPTSGSSRGSFSREPIDGGAALCPGRCHHLRPDARRSDHSVALRDQLPRSPSLAAVAARFQTSRPPCFPGLRQGRPSQPASEWSDEPLEIGFARSHVRG